MFSSEESIWENRKLQLQHKINELRCETNCARIQLQMIVCLPHAFSELEIIQWRPLKTPAKYLKNGRLRTGFGEIAADLLIKHDTASALYERKNDENCVSSTQFNVNKLRS